MVLPKRLIDCNLCAYLPGSRLRCLLGLTRSHTPEFLLVDKSADLPALDSAFLLVEPEVYPPVDARVVDIVCDRAQGVVLQHESWHRRAREHDRVRSIAENPRQDFARGVTRAGVS